MSLLQRHGLARVGGVVSPVQRFFVDRAGSLVRLLVRMDLLWVGVIFCLALAVRLVWITYATADPTDGRFDDSLFYHYVGASLAGGGGYSDPFTGLPTAQFPPGYPFFLAGLYWLFGPSVEAAEAANAVLGAGTVVVVYLLAQKLFAIWPARIAAILLAFVPQQIFFSSLLFSETLFTFLFVLALLLLLTATRRGGQGGWYWLIAFGLVAGAASLVRESGLALLLIGIVFWFFSGRGWWTSLRWTAITMLAFSALVLPWSVRNYLVFDEPLLLTSKAGMGFYIGHHEGANGSFQSAAWIEMVEEFGSTTSPGAEGVNGLFQSPAWIELMKQYGSTTGPRAEVAINNAALRKAVSYALSHPVEEIQLAGKKLVWLYRPGGSVGLDWNEFIGARPFIAPELRILLTNVSTGYYWAVFLLASLAFVYWARKRGRAPLLLVIAIAVVTMGHIATFGLPRYHFPLTPLFCILAGWALTELAGSSLNYLARWRVIGLPAFTVNRGKGQAS